MPTRYAEQYETDPLSRSGSTGVSSEFHRVLARLDVGTCESACDPSDDHAAEEVEHYEPNDAKDNAPYDSHGIALVLWGWVVS